MQLLKFIAFFSLLSVQSLANPIKDFGSNLSLELTKETKLEERANPTGNIIPVGMGEVDRALPGNTLFTNGLATCLSIIIRTRYRGQEEVAYDKLLAHVSPKLCTDEDSPSTIDQLRAMWSLYDDQPFTNQYLADPEVLFINPDGTPFANQWMNAVADTVRVEAFRRGLRYTRILRDTRFVNAEGGSRMWIDAEQRVFWSIFDTPIA